MNTDTLTVEIVETILRIEEAICEELILVDDKTQDFALCFVSNDVTPKQRGLDEDIVSVGSYQDYNIYRVPLRRAQLQDNGWAVPCGFNEFIMYADYVFNTRDVSYYKNRYYDLNQLPIHPELLRLQDLSTRAREIREMA